MFRLSARKASKRVSVWRKLQKYGAVNWENCAYVLPSNPSSMEKFQWLAAEVRKHQGKASVVGASRVYESTDKQMMAAFNENCARQYEGLIRDTRLALRAAASRSKAQLHLDFSRHNRRFAEILNTDFFGCAKRKEAEELLKEVESKIRGNGSTVETGRNRRGNFQGRTWQTRPRPEVDRVASAWLIRHFIDPKAKFAFSPDAEAYPGSVRFDMFQGDFTHVGDECTFEVLLKYFGLRDKRLRLIGQLVHDADLEDNKFGHPQGTAIDLVLKGWAKMGWPDEKILHKGFELYDALYLTLAA